MMRLVEIALREVGVKEQGGENRGPEIERYQRATSLEPGAWPWCAAFVAWVLLQRLNDPYPFTPFADARRKSGIARDQWRFDSAAARQLEVWGRLPGRGDVLLPGYGALAHPGDFVTYDFSMGDGLADHCGIVVADNGKFVTAVEGNTSDPNGPAANERNGGGVYLKVRSKALVRRYVRLVP